MKTKKVCVMRGCNEIRECGKFCVKHRLEGVRWNPNGPSLRRYVDPKIKKFAAELRDRQTPAEKILWEELRARHLRGLRFRRQVVLRGYIVDFYCPAKRLAIELDGAGHSPAKDAIRTKHIEKLSIGVLRFSNEAVKIRLPEVLNAIALRCGVEPFPQINRTHHHHHIDLKSGRVTAVETSYHGGNVEKRVKSLKDLVRRGGKDCGWFEDSVESCGKQVFADLEVAGAAARILEKFGVTVVIVKKCAICGKIHMEVLR